MESGRKLYPELFWVLAQRISVPNSCFEPSLFRTPFRWLQHFFFVHIWHLNVLTNNANKVHLDNQFHHIVGVLSILTSIWPYLVFFHPHTLWRKKKKIWESGKDRQFIPIHLTAVTWTSISLRVQSFQASEFNGGKQATTMFGLHKSAGLQDSYIWIEPFCRKNTPVVGWLRGPSPSWSAHTLGGWTTQRSPSSSNGLMFELFSSPQIAHLCLVVAVALVFVTHIIADQVTLFISMHAQSNLVNLWQSTKSLWWPKLNVDFQMLPKIIVI